MTGETMSDQTPIEEILHSTVSAETAPTADVPAAAAPIEQSDEGKSWTYQAVKDERTKRQALERQLSELLAERESWQERQQTNARDEFWADPEKQFQQMNDRATAAVRRASEAAAISRHGRETFDAMEKAVREAMARNDPDMHLLYDSIISSDDPASVAMNWYFSTQGNAQPATPMPKNLATARNAGGRTQSWGGPLPLQDIFDRRNARRSA